jgi:hypothetical protein
MSLSKTTLSAIQQAGQALHKATVVVACAVRAQAEHMVATVASQPFQAEGEQAFANFKMLARLSQDLQTLEEQLKGLYATASELASPEMDVVAALPHGSSSNNPPGAVADVADAIVKPATPRRSDKKGAKKSANPATLTDNDSKVLQYLKSVLKPGQTSALTGATIAKGSGLPLGSVGISLKKVIDSGAVKKIGRSSYQRAH